MGAVYWAAQLWIPHSVALVICLTFGVLLTGAFHEDGLADFCDAFGGQGSKEKLIEIMHDSRIGTYGTLALVLILLTKYAALWGKPPHFVIWNLLLAHTLSRCAAVFIMATMPYVERHGGKPVIKPVAENLKTIDLLLPVFMSLLICLVALKPAQWLMPVLGPMHQLFPSLGSPWHTEWSVAVVVWPRLILALILIALIIGWMRNILKKRLGGYTGDTLGATQQLCEVAVLVALSQF
jgi:adenosylcobinamide-GDP ribazoletransferase